MLTTVAADEDHHLDARRRDTAGTSRASILVLTQVLPWPLDSGPKVRARHVLEWLAERYDVDLVTFVRADDPEDGIERLKNVCRRVITVPVRRSGARNLIDLARALLTGRSFVLLRDDQRAMRDAIADACSSTDYDAVHADQVWMAVHAMRVPCRLRVVDMHNALFLVFQRLASETRTPHRRWIYAREARALAREEAAMVDRFHRMIFVTAEDLEAVRSVSTPAQAAALDERATIIPICVDPTAAPPVGLSEDADRVTFLGTLYWPPNASGVRWLYREVMPLVWRAVPRARLTIVGKRPPADIREWSTEDAGAEGPVDVTGYVPDVRPLLKETAAFVVPLRSGGGMRVKILDAWRWGLPVISTTIGAEGIDTDQGRDAWLADSASDFADGIIRLLRDPEARTGLAHRGRKAVSERYDVRRVYPLLDAVYAPVCGGGTE